MEETCPQTAVEESLDDLEMTPRKIGEWMEDQERGTWIYKDDEIEIHVSFWQHLDFKDSYTACIRWEYQMNHLATYIKIQDDDGDLEKLLMHAAGFVTNWLAEKKEEVKE